jgi:hypothetical protein
MKGLSKEFKNSGNVFLKLLIGVDLIINIGLMFLLIL